LPERRAKQGGQTGEVGMSEGMAEIARCDQGVARKNPNAEAEEIVGPAGFCGPVFSVCGLDFADFETKVHVAAMAKAFFRLPDQIERDSLDSV
jgi:hypothetical protein